MAVLPQAAVDILHVHNRIIDHHADGDRQAAEGHRVDRDAGELEIEPGHDERKGYGGQRDRRGAEVEQEEKKHDDDHDGAVPDRFLHVLDRRLDEIGLFEQLVDFYVRRQRLADLRQRRLNLAREADGVDARLLLHGENHGGLAVHAGVAAHDLPAELHGGDIMQVHGDALAHHDDGVGNVFERGGAPHVADERLLVGVFQEAAGGVALRLPGGGNDLLQADAVGGEFFRRRQDLILLHAPADGDHLRNAGDREQPLAHGPVGERADVHRGRRAGFALQADQHDLAHDGTDRPHGRRDAAGEFFRGELQALLHELARAVDVHAPVKLDIEHRQPDARGGAHPFHAGRTVKRGLHWQVDQGLDLLGCEASGLGENVDGRAVQIGEHVDRQLKDDVAAVDEQQRARRQHEEAVAQGKFDESIEHGEALCLMALRLGRGLPFGGSMPVCDDLLGRRRHILELVVAHGDDIRAGQDAFYNLDEAIIPLADNHRRAEKGLRILVVLHEHEKVARLAQHRGKRHGNDRIRLGSHDAECSTHVRQQPQSGVWNAHPHAEGAGFGIELRGMSLDRALKKLVGIGLSPHPHLLVGLNLSDLSLVNPGDDVKRGKIGDLQQVRVGFDAVSGEDMAVQHGAVDVSLEFNARWGITNLPALDFEQEVALGNLVTFFYFQPRDTPRNAARQCDDTRGVNFHVTQCGKRLLDGPQIGGFHLEAKIFYRFGRKLDWSGERTVAVITGRLVVASMGKEIPSRLRQ